MAFQLSPGVVVVEKDLTNVVPAVSTSIGGLVGDFQWGPVLEPTLVTSEVELVKTFGKPNTDTANSFFSAANFLAYSNNLKVVRVIDEDVALNAVAQGAGRLIKNRAAWDADYASESATSGLFAAKWPGKLGNTLLVSMADSATFGSWTYKGEFDLAPDTSSYVEAKGGSKDELHVIVVDEDGLFTGVPGTVLEKFAFVSKASDAKTDNGASNYYVNVLKGSKYAWWISHPRGSEVVAADAKFGDTAVTGEFEVLTAPVGGSLTLGDEDVAANTQLGWDLFTNAEAIDVNLLITAGASLTDAAYVVTNVAEVRRDCVAFISPALVHSDVPLYAETASAATTAITGDRSTLNVNSSYAVMDSGWKYQYDKYADTYRWVPLNGDVAGLCARTDLVSDPWFSPAGLNRGVIKNTVKLAFSPNAAQRDELYKVGVNPVVSFPGQGTVLYGDKTLLSKPSAFDRINVRRLFIVLEKAIATAAKYQLFEFNDAFTRAQFKNLVEPFLRDVKGRRGIYDFKVVCDETNNTGEVIDRNEFVADIYIKPARSINFITLNFIATRTGISFEEVAGA